MHSHTGQVAIGIVRLLVTAIFFTFCLGPSPQVVLAADLIYYVTENATSSGSGLSWDEPVSLSTALQLVTEHPETQAQIWVAAGTYYPVAAVDIDARTATFTIPENASLYGGFTIDSDFTQRDWATNQTTLSGNIGLAESSEDNSYHVVTFAPANNDTHPMLDGFVIQDGNANSSLTPTDPNANGGGIWILDAEPILNHLIIRNNAAGDQGGGIFAQQSYRIQSYHLVIQNSQILNNQAKTGGGLASNGSDLDLVNTVFYGNMAFTTGGAIALGAATNVMLVNDSIVNNTAQSGVWAISAPPLSYVDLDNSIVWNSRSLGSAFPIGLFLYCDHSLLPADSSCLSPDSPQNINANPQFVNLPEENQPADLRLQPYSPAINAGDQSNLPGEVKTDLAGNPRINGAEVDLGAYEAQQVNQAPILTQTQLTLSPVTRQISSQVTLHDLIQKMGASDPDSIQLGGAIYGVAIIGYDSVPGKWEYSLDGGASWQAVGPVSSQSALLLQDTPGTRLRFSLTGPFGGITSLQLRAWDGADQWTNASRVNISAIGRTTPYSAETANASLLCLGLQTFMPMLSREK